MERVVAVLVWLSLALSWYLTTHFTTYRPQLRPAPAPVIYTPTPAQLEALRRDGAVLLPRVLSGDWLDYMEEV